MAKNIIKIIEEKSQISSGRYPLDLHFVREVRKDFFIEVEKTKDQKPVEVNAIRYSGGIKLSPVSPISLIINPEEIIANERCD